MSLVETFFKKKKKNSSSVKTGPTKENKNWAQLTAWAIKTERQDMDTVHAVNHKQKAAEAPSLPLFQPFPLFMDEAEDFYQTEESDTERSFGQQNKTPRDWS